MKNFFKKAYLFLFLCIYPKTVLALENIDSYVSGNENHNEAISTAKTKLGTIVGSMRFIGVGCCVIMLIWCAAQLAMSAGNVQKKAQAMEGVKNVLIAVAIIGALTIILSAAYHFL